MRGCLDDTKGRSRLTRGSLQCQLNRELSYAHGAAHHTPHSRRGPSNPAGVLSVREPGEGRGPARVRGGPLLAPAREASRHPPRLLGLRPARGAGGDHHRHRPHHHRSGLALEGDGRGARSRPSTRWSNPALRVRSRGGHPARAAPRRARAGEPLRDRARSPTPRCCAPTTTASTPTTGTRPWSPSSTSCTRPCCACWSRSSWSTSPREDGCSTRGAGAASSPRSGPTGPSRSWPPTWTTTSWPRARPSSRTCGGSWATPSPCPSGTTPSTRSSRASWSSTCPTPCPPCASSAGC